MTFVVLPQQKNLHSKNVTFVWIKNEKYKNENHKMTQGYLHLTLKTIFL